MSWPSGLPIETLLGLVLLGFLVWELRNLRRTQRLDREKAQQAEARPPE